MCVLQSQVSGTDVRGEKSSGRCERVQKPHLLHAQDRGLKANAPAPSRSTPLPTPRKRAPPRPRHGLPSTPSSTHGIPTTPTIVAPREGSSGFQMSLSPWHTIGRNPRPRVKTRVDSTQQSGRGTRTLSAQGSTRQHGAEPSTPGPPPRRSQGKHDSRTRQTSHVEG